MSATQGFLLFAAGLLLGATGIAFLKTVEDGLKFVDRLYTSAPQARPGKR